MFNKIDEISLLVYLFSRSNKKGFKKVLSKYSGCSEEVYTERELINLCQKAIIQISRKYHIPGLFYEYFDSKTRWETYSKLYNEPYSELDTLGNTLFGISPKIFDEEDKTRIKELKEKYIEE